MKILKITTYNILICFNFIFAQHIEEDTLVNKPINKLWETLQTDESVININHDDLISNEQAESFDFKRNVELQSIQNAMLLDSFLVIDFNSLSLKIDNSDYHFNGKAYIKRCKPLSMVIKGDTTVQLSKVKINEQYYLIDEIGDTIATYDNQYICFLDVSGSIQLEVFNKSRAIQNTLNETFFGVGTNNLEILTPSIQLLLHPNPTSTNSVSVNFILPKSGQFKLFIQNQIGTINQQVYDSELVAGNYSIPLDLTEFPSGLYQLQANYNNKTYTQTIIKE
jgi:hypothetical protein